MAQRNQYVNLLTTSPLDVFLHRLFSALAIIFVAMCPLSLIVWTMWVVIYGEINYDLTMIALCWWIGVNLSMFCGESCLADKNIHLLADGN